MVHSVPMDGPLTPEQLEPIRQALFNRNKIEAIKLFRAATSTGLAEAKQAVEDLEVQWGLAEPRRTSFSKSTAQPAKTGTTGCLVLLIAAGLAGALGIALLR